LSSSGRLEELRKCQDYDMNECLLRAVKHNRREIVEYLLENGATDINNALSVSCDNNLYDISELLVKRGASIVYGLRKSKSPNITRMLYRYDQRSENIM
jgi:ankyrin repeat protein